MSAMVFFFGQRHYRRDGAWLWEDTYQDPNEFMNIFKAASLGLGGKGQSSSVIRVPNVSTECISANIAGHRFWDYNKPVGRETRRQKPETDACNSSDNPPPSPHLPSSPPFPFPSLS